MEEIELNTKAYICTHTYMYMYMSHYIYMLSSPSPLLSLSLHPPPSSPYRMVLFSITREPSYYNVLCVYKCIIVHATCSCFHRSCKNTSQWIITLSLANAIIEILLTTHRVLFAVSNYNVERCLTTSQRTRTTNTLNSTLGLFLFGV